MAGPKETTIRFCLIDFTSLFKSSKAPFADNNSDFLPQFYSAYDYPDLKSNKIPDGVDGRNEICVSCHFFKIFPISIF